MVEMYMYMYVLEYDGDSSLLTTFVLFQYTVFSCDWSFLLLCDVSIAG